MTPATTSHGHELTVWIDQVKAELSKGPARALPPPEQAAEVLRGLMATVPHPLADRIGPVWTSVHTREQLGLNTRQALDSRRRSGSVLGVRASTGEVFYPLSQFRVTHGTVEVRPALAAMFRVLRDQDPWAVATLLTVPAPELDDHTPLQWEREGRSAEDMVRLARRVRHEWAA